MFKVTNDDHDTDCNCCDCGDEPEQVKGAQPPPTSPKVVIKTKTDVRLTDAVDQLDNVGDEKVLVTLPDNPRKGKVIDVNACEGPVEVEGGCFDIIGQSPDGTFYVPAGTACLFIFTSCCEWMPLLGAPNTQGEIYVKDIAALAALKTNPLREQTRAHVETLDGTFELAKTSTETPDGITIVPASDGGNWLRIETFSKKSSLQITWYICPSTGDDENDGTSSTCTSGTRVGPLKTAAEACRRLHQCEGGKNYQLRLLNNVPQQESDYRPFGQVYIQDTFRFSPVFEQNPEDVSGSNGYEQTFNATLRGVDPLSRTPLLSFTISAFTATSGNNQNTITVATPGLLDPYVGKMVVVTSGPLAGSTAGIGKSLGGGVYRMSRFIDPSNAQVNLTNTESLAVIDLVQWNRPIIQLGNSQGRYLILNLDFPNVDAPPAPQLVLSYRYTSLSWTRCRFRRNTQGTGTNINGAGFEVSNYANSGLVGCIFDYSGLTGQGVGGSVIVVLGNGMTIAALTGCLFINADVRAMRTGEVTFTSCYLQGSRFTTFNSTTYESYGFFNVGGGFCQAQVHIFGQGLAVYDWPAPSAPNDAGIRLSGGSVLFVHSGSSGGFSTNIYGSSAAGVGLRVSEGSKFFWEKNGTVKPTLTAPTEFLLENSANAMPPIELSAGLVLPMPAACNSWATHWDSGTFQRKVMNYATGACITEVDP